MKKNITTFFLSLLLCANIFAQDTLFVKESASSAAWAGRTAYTNLQDAIDAAQAGDMIWVAEGTYYPSATFNNSNDVRCKSFVMKDSITLYGGFDGTETDLDDRAWEETVLSGDIAHTPEVATDNVYHVVFCNNTNHVVLDGFTITGGYANREGYLDDQDGAGVYMGANGQLRNCYVVNNIAMKNGGGVWVSSTGTLADCYFSNNSVFAANSSGGAAYFDNRSFNAPTAAENCYFEENSCAATNNITGSNRYGGGAVNAGQNTQFEYCIFTMNSCTNPGGAVICSSSNEFAFCAFYLNKGINGGAIYGGNNSNLLASNCLFANNEASSKGGAVYYTGSSCRAINSTFVNNAAVTGAAIYGSSNFTLFNSIVWNNDTVPANQVSGTSNVTCKYTAIQGVLASGEGNLNVTTEEIAFYDPCTIIGIPDSLTEEVMDSIFDAEYGITGHSVCKDAGNLGTLYLSGYQFPGTDLNGDDRVVGSAIDLGCFENPCENIAPTFTWTVLDTTYNTVDTGAVAVSDGTGTVTIEFTITNYDEDFTYFIVAGTAIMMDGNTVTVPFHFPCSDTVTISYTYEDCGAEASTVITIDSLYAPVGIAENTPLTATLYPNPAHNTLTVESASPIREITVYDMTGRAVMVRANHHSTQRWDINVASLHTGIYIVNVITDKGTKTAKFVKK